MFMYVRITLESISRLWLSVDSRRTQARRRQQYRADRKRTAVYERNMVTRNRHDRTTFRYFLAYLYAVMVRRLDNPFAFVLFEKFILYFQCFSSRFRNYSENPDKDRVKECKTRRTIIGLIMMQTPSRQSVNALDYNV